MQAPPTPSIPPLSPTTIAAAMAPQLDASPASTWAALSRCREASPLVQCISNYVAMDLMANSLLAAGASPAMVSHPGGRGIL